MNAPLPLAALQRWMLAVITHPAGARAGDAQAQLDKLILPSRQQSAAERMAVYSSAYFARLLEVLRELFPCLRFAVGDELFDQFAVQYVEAHPPGSYTLHRLADEFAEFLEATRPRDDDWLGFVVDLARLEHAIDQVFDGPGPELTSGPRAFRGNELTLASNQLPAKDSRPPGVTLVPGFRLLTFRFPVSSYFTAWKAGEQPAWPAARQQHVALLRRDYIVRRHELTPIQFDLLSRLAAGQTLDQSLAAIAVQYGSIDDLAADVECWFTHWSAAGFFLATDS
jgi:hypothetical protein